MKRISALPLVLLFALASCGGFDDVGRAPGLTSISDGAEHEAMVDTPLPVSYEGDDPTAASSLWAADRASLLGDRRAEKRGDIMTVVVEINDRAEFSNSSQRSRTASEQASVGSLFGANTAIFNPAIEAESASSSNGSGKISRNEKLTLRIAATVINVLPNGVLEIQGTQEVRVNNELRELTVQGYVRPEDISRQNEITYDKIASARISYGGRGRVSEVQDPRYGQQIIDKVLPF